MWTLAGSLTLTASLFAAGQTAKVDQFGSVKAIRTYEPARQLDFEVEVPVGRLAMSGIRRSSTWPKATPSCSMPFTIASSTGQSIGSRF